MWMEAQVGEQRVRQGEEGNYHRGHGTLSCQGFGVGGQRTHPSGASPARWGAAWSLFWAGGGAGGGGGGLSFPALQAHGMGRESGLRLEKALK